jgi:hypothetical protein
LQLSSDELYSLAKSTAESTEIEDALEYIKGVLNRVF